MCVGYHFLAGRQNKNFIKFALSFLFLGLLVTFSYKYSSRKSLPFGKGTNFSITYITINRATAAIGFYSLLQAVFLLSLR